MQVMGCVEVGEGSVNYASVPVRRVVEMALDLGATSVVVAHNHPSGIALPSGDDIQTTRRLAAAFSAVEIVMIDHLVFADGDYVSLAQSGYCFDDCLAL
jgi:DNA repair protein RadC